MNVKIQGSGNGTYANTGSCVAVTNYLQHEDLERMKKGEEVQPFFNQFRDYVSAREVTFKIDNNKAKLSRTDAKFYVITVSPSEKELRCMGRTPQECAEALRRYIRQDVMRNYAEGFGKGLKSDDVEYYAKIHFNRDGESDSDMHAHIIVSRKDRSNTRKLSPKTNHTGKKNCGNVKGGFDRTDFFRKCESSFDRRMGFDREPEESFDYLNAVKNGSPAEIARQVERAERIRKEKWDKLKAELQSRQEPEKSKNQQVEKTPDIEQPIPQKEAAGGRSGTPEEAKKEQRFRNGHVIFLFSGTKVTPHAAFVKGRFTLRVKNLLCSLRSCGIFYPSPLTNTLCFAGRCLGKKKKMLFFGECPFCHFVTGICPHGGGTAPIS